MYNKHEPLSIYWFYINSADKFCLRLFVYLDLHEIKHNMIGVYSIKFAKDI